MYEIQNFAHERFGNVRVVTLGGDPWFVASDVCKALGIGNNRQAVSGLDDDEKNTVIIADGIPGNPNKTVISEAGLYTLILRSRKPEAQQFRRWITHEVIPAIRKHGAYFTNAKLAQLLQDPEQAHLLVMEYVAEALENERLTMQLQDALPKAAYYDTFVNPMECTNLRITAKELGVPEKQFTKFLMNHRYLYRAPSGKLMPYVHYYNKGYFIIRDFHKRNSPDVGHYTLVTAAGKEHLMYRVPEILGEAK